VLPHEDFHIQPGGIGPLGEGVLALIHLVVEDLEADVGDTDVVDIRENQGDSRGDPIPVLDGNVIFTADITAGFLDL